MNALIWKKISGLRKEKIKLLVYFILPIIYLNALVIFNVNAENIIAYYSFNVTLISSLVCFSIEDILYSECILATNISIKKIWNSNMLFITIVGYIYSTVILIIGIIVMNYIHYIKLIILLQYFACILGSMGLIGFSTIHFCDYSTIKKGLASIASLIIIINPIAIFYYGKRSILSLNELVTFTIISGVLLGISYLIIRNPNKENLIVNTKNLIKVYEKSNSIEE